MTFDDILEQVITLLKRQGRVSYPALKIRFSLDDDYLEALKAEILYVHPVVLGGGKPFFEAGSALELMPLGNEKLPQDVMLLRYSAAG